MTRHLSPEAVIEAAEAAGAPEAPAAIAAAARAHLDECERCATEVRDTRAVLEAARAIPMPEPSPLYWDHLSARVGEATAAAPVPRRAWWPRRAWGPLLAGAVTVALVVTLSVERRTPGAAPDVPMPNIAGADAWDDVLVGVRDLSSDDVQTLAPWAAGPVLLVADLTPEERDAFASLLEREMADAQP